MNIKGIIWAGLSVADLEKEIAFYRDFLGLRLLRQGAGWAHFDAGNGALLELFSGGTASQAPKTPVQQPLVIGFQVGNLRLTVDELSAKGVQFIGEIEGYKNTSWAHFADPEGNRLEIKEIPQ
jgi:predicted enzyme related to lactoylglutathione lyase